MRDKFSLCKTRLVLQELRLLAAIFVFALFASCQNPWFQFQPDDGTVQVDPPASPVTYAVTVIGGTGSGNYAQGASVTITAATPPEGQQFKNWTTASAGVSFADANNANTTFTMPPNAVTVTANFEAIPAGNYLITVTSVGYGTANANEPSAAPGATITLSATPNPGYKFVNWTTESAGVTFANANSASTTFTMPGNAVTVTANFEPIPTYAVTLNYNNGSSNGSQSVMHGGMVDKPTDPTRSGYTFEDWYRDNTFQTTWVFATDTVTANITLYAKWTLTNSASNPFLVTNAAELGYVGKGAANSNLYKDWTLGAYYKQTANITLTGNWTPIGPSASTSNMFTGTYNGGGYTISDLTINAATMFQGMFGYINDDGRVENLGLIDVSITNSSNWTGGIAGFSSGTIQNCYVTGNVTGNANVGGITGVNSGFIYYCYVVGSVTGTSTVGGIVGSNSIALRNCVALNRSVTNTEAGTQIGRIIGIGDSYSLTSNNYAWSGMTLEVAGTPTAPTETTAAGKDGADITAAQAKTQSTWTTAGFTFKAVDGPWVWNSTYLRPVLINEVPQAWPSYLVDP